MQILHLINFAGSGGSEKYVRTLLQRQTEAGHGCVLAYNIEGPLVEEARAIGAGTVRVRMRSIADFAAVRALRVLIRERGIDVIHAHYPRENCLAVLAARGSRTKVVLTAHLVEPCGALWRRINRIFSPHDHAVLCVCRAQLSQLAENGIRPDRLRVIPNGVRPDRVEDPEALRAAIRREFSIPPDAFVAATLTRYEPVKGVDMLLDTARELRDRLPDMRFLVAGSGSQFDEIRETLAREGLSEYFLQAGFRSDTDAVLCAADVYLNTSRSEALSFAITEAMSLEKPAVITAVGGNPEIIPPDSDCGFLVPFGDSRAMADALVRLAEDPDLRREMGACAARRVREEFTEDVMVEKIMAAYR